MATWKTTSIHLRPVRCEPTVPDGFTLSQSLIQALGASVDSVKIRDSWILRQYNYDDTDVIVMNVLSSSKNEVYCQFARIEKDGLLPIANTQKGSGGNLTIDQIKTPDGHDPCKATSLLYVNGNQSLLVDAGIRSSSIEKYLTWLLNERSGLFNDLVIKLAAKFELTNGQNANLDVTEINIAPRGVHMPTPLESKIYENTSTEEMGTLTKPQKILEILKLVGVGYKAYEKIQEEAGGDALIELALNIKVRKRNQLVSLQKVDFEEIARDFGDDEVKLRGRDGQVVGKMATVKFPARITCAGSIFDSTDALRQIRSAWDHFVAQGYIQ